MPRFLDVVQFMVTFMMMDIRLLMNWNSDNCITLSGGFIIRALLR
ncbi:MAG: hypothetical protein U0T32_07370 [Chitinophagales bacterium]